MAPLDSAPTPPAPAPGSPLRFAKGHGARNDFVILQDPDGAADITPELVQRLTERTAGLGADGLIRVVRTRAAGIDAPADAPVWFMDYRNADGSIAEMCGNGVRVFAAELRRTGLVGADRFDIWTRAGVRTVEILSPPEAGEGTWQVRVGMGPARLTGEARTVTVAGHELAATEVDMGNPHTVAFLPDDAALEDVDLTRRPALAPEPPHGTNVELVVPRGERHVAMRVHERGVGETLACGTGACAVAVAAALRAGDESRRPWRVDLPGGTLTIGWTPEGDVTLAGPAQIVAEGTLLV